MNAIHDPFIHKLPPELGSHIFHLCLPTTDPTRPPYYPQKDVLRVLRLGAVCRKWRQLAWATPNLWEILSISIYLKIKRTLAGSLPVLINEWLGRSRGLPLTICFLYDEGDFDDPGEFDEALEGIIDVLTSHSSRWRNLCLYVDPRTLERLSGSMQLNQLLGLELLVYVEGPMSRSAQNIIMKSKPFPTYLRLSNISPTLIDIGWNNLTEATLSCLTTNDCAEVFRRAHALEHFHVEEFPDPDESMVHVDVLIIHPRIRSLHLPVDAKDFLNMLNVPSLEEWTQDADDDTLLVPAMISLLQRSSCRLKILNLRDISSQQNNLVSIFRATPFLERLGMHFLSPEHPSNEVDDILVRIFHSPSDQSSPHESFLPHLQFLECSTLHSRAGPFSWDHIPDLYRLGHRYSLTLKSAIDTSKTSDETAMELLKLVDEGAKFLISDSTEGGNFLENFKKKRIGREGSSVLPFADLSTEILF